MTVNPSEQSMSAPDPRDLAIPVAEALPAGEFKLLRALLVDSLSKGRIVDFELDGGAIVTGTNGGGKTSMLQLLLLFYGTNPNDLVSPGKDSFIQYYLPRVTSYIAFEYQRDDGQKRMVVAYANTTGEKVFYRFVRQGFDDRIFISDDKTFIENEHLKRRLVELDIGHSPKQVSTYTDYRAIIQFSPSRVSDRQAKEFVKELCYDYSFTRIGKPLTHVDRLALGMFSQKSNFEDLQSIVIDSVSDNLLSQSIRIDRTSVESWPRKYHSYLAVMAEKETYQNALEDKKGYDDRRQTLSELHQKVIMLHDQLLIQVARASDQLAQAKAQQVIEGTAYLAEQKNLQSEEVKTQLALDNVTKVIAEITEGKATFDREDILARHRAYKNKDNLENQQASLKAQIEALTGDQKSIVGKFQLIKYGIQEANGRELAVLQEQRDAARDTLQHQLRSNQDLLAREEGQREAAYQDARATRENLAQSLSEQLGGLKHRVDYPVVSAELLQLQANKGEQIGRTRASLAKLQGELHQAERQQDKSKSEVERIEQRVSTAKKAAILAEEQLQEILKSSQAEPGTLLHFLREATPEWGVNIARVVRRDILLRTDLSPCLVSGGSGVFGLELDLGALDPVAESNAEFMQAAIEEAQESLKKADDLLAALQAERKLATEQNEKDAKAVSALFKSKLSLSGDLALMEKEHADLALQLVQATKKAKAEAEAQLELLKSKIADAKNALATFDQSYHSDRQNLRERFAVERARHQAEFDSTNTNLSAAFEALRQQTEAQIRDCDVQCQQALEAKGVDVGALAKLQQQVDHIEATLQEMRAYHKTYLCWMTWYQQVFSRLSEHEARQSDLSQELQLRRQAIANHASAYALQVESLNQSIATLDAQHQQSQQDALLASGTKEKLIAFEPSSTAITFDPNWTAQALSAASREALADLRRHTMVLDAKLLKLKKAFESHINSPAYDAFTFYGQHHHIEKSQDFLPFYTAWYEGQHKDVFFLLRQTAREFSNEVAAFHSTLRTFNDRLNRFNRELQEHLNSYNSDFGSISGLNVTIHSTVDELKFWGVLKRIVTSRDTWIRDDEKLPDHDFVECMQALLDNWELKRGITADFKHLINIRGSVTEKGNLRHFRRSEDLGNVSSTGLSYIVLMILFVAFWRKIRKDAPVRLVWALDELRTIDIDNISGLTKLLDRNHISLASACPDSDAKVICHFQQRYRIDPDRRLSRVEIVPFTAKGVE